jgi:general secretion pathway protein A
MYRAFFGLREKPFNLTPDPKFLYLNASYREALAALRYGIAGRKGFVSLIGEAGTGKTTLLRCLLAELGPEVRSVLVLNPAVGFDELLTFILTDLGHPPLPGTPKLELLQALNTELLETLHRGGNVVVLIDEAQDLAIVVLEELRLLSNLETANEKILQLVLAGQPELDAMLARRELRQLRQRIAVPARLRPLVRGEVEAYVAARIHAAGGDPRGLFTRPALHRLWRFSHGVPRLVNVACDNALVTAYAEGSRRITWKIMGDVARDLRRVDQETSGRSLLRLRPRTVAVAAIVGALIGVAGGRLNDARWTSGSLRLRELAASWQLGASDALTRLRGGPAAGLPHGTAEEPAADLARVEPHPETPNPGPTSEGAAPAVDANGVVPPAASGRDRSPLATRVARHGDGEVPSPLAVAAGGAAPVEVPVEAAPRTAPTNAEAAPAQVAAAIVSAAVATAGDMAEGAAGANAAAPATPAEAVTPAAEIVPAAGAERAPKPPDVAGATVAAASPADAASAPAVAPAPEVVSAPAVVVTPEPVPSEAPADVALASRDASVPPAPVAVPAPVAPETGTPAAAPPREIRIQKGDDLTHLARRYYGYDSRLLLEEIRRANPSIANFNRLPIGQTLILPPDPFTREPSAAPAEVRR